MKISAGNEAPKKLPNNIFSLTGRGRRRPKSRSTVPGGPGSTKGFPGGKLENLALWSSNIRGLRGNYDELTQLIDISEIKPDVISLCETFLSEEVLDEVVNIDGYNVHRRDRPSSNFGGIAVYTKEGLSFSRRLDLEDGNFEYIWLESVSNNPKLHVISVYRPPDADDSILDVLDRKLTRIRNDEHVLIAGDFNAKHSSWFSEGVTDCHGLELFNFCNTNNLFQLVSGPTRIPDNPTGKMTQIDFVFTDIEECESSSICPPIGSSDHTLIKSVLTFPVLCTSPTERYVWKYHQADWEGMRKYLKQYSFAPLLCSKDPDVCWNNWKLAIIQICSMFIPFRKVSNRKKKNPWFNKTCADAIIEKKTAFVNIKGTNDAAGLKFFSEKRTMLYGHAGSLNASTRGAYQFS